MKIQHRKDMNIKLQAFENKLLKIIIKAFKNILPKILIKAFQENIENSIW